MELPGNNIETLQQPFQYPFRNMYYNQPPRTFARPKGEYFKCGKPEHHARTCGKWCEFHGRYGHNTEKCRDKLSYTSVNSIQQPRCAKIQKTMNHFSSHSSNLNALEHLIPWNKILKPRTITTMHAYSFISISFASLLRL